LRGDKHDEGKLFDEVEQKGTVSLCLALWDVDCVLGGSIFVHSKHNGETDQKVAAVGHFFMKAY